MAEGAPATAGASLWEDWTALAMLRQEHQENARARSHIG